MSTTHADAAWKKLRDAKLKTRDSLIPAQYRIPDINAKAHASVLNDIEFIATLLTREERTITGCSATVCARWIASGKWTSVRVGVPVSIKDNINIAGPDSSVGFISPKLTHIRLQT
ncbi:hypothetical protein M427DRAFT_32123 [Gonapodya prolifera JEL478]|uniref:Uncharacterized protein n=1 Tax=Gonapodya prolifera (strain JEL478) TaxID=1344416 RepID=A0A139AFX8_GONPJ|nr:hypothetical protein M427DRAFT_32123 [Gonapodya prolifera JEL478]|eukprot:KXS15697.1 hypothetical protein M427DRAFT_32123 [Gonapodya prolifera JEL478]